jgi:CheY-like chemotaxis protein
MRISSIDHSTHEWSRNIIDRQVMQLTRLVDDLLDVGRITSGKIVLRKEPVEMNAAILRAVESCQPQIDARRHSLELLLPREPLLVDGDLVRLSQIVLNLLNNAVKYTPDGGKIQIALEQEGDCALVRVKDTGIGMSASLIPVAFDLFVQEKHSLSRTEGGLGVGLTVVRHLVQMHGGSVTARSGGAAMGSEFIVRLPMLTLKLGTREPDSNWQPKSVLAKRRILIVDDNHDSADSLALLLRAAGHEVRTLYDGPAVCSVAEEFQPHLLLLDIGLPNMDGYEVARQLRNSAKLRNVVLVAFTGYGTDDDRQRARQAGFDHHLVKPLEPEALENIIDSTSG